MQLSAAKKTRCLAEMSARAVPTMTIASVSDPNSETPGRGDVGEYATSRVTQPVGAFAHLLAEAGARRCHPLSIHGDGSRGLDPAATRGGARMLARCEHSWHVPYMSEPRLGCSWTLVTARLACITLIGLFAVRFAAAEAPKPTDVPVFKSMTAHQLSPLTGKLSDVDALIPTGTDKSNDVEAGTLLVVVELGGPAIRSYHIPKPAYHVQLIATDLVTSRRLSSETRTIRSMNDKGSQFFGYIVSHDPCHAVQLMVRITGPGVAAPVVKKIASYGCGE